ncbi:CoA pyrophosphatase [Bengtsoniella intestinalis]|uniref:NUDIX hydrolase n=1 Tax=Bengtsoniella intestinalis TaxID=3073143 RepID=UPI00391F74E6
MNIYDLQQTLANRRPSMMGAQRTFAVLCPLVTMDDGQWGLLFEVRAASLRAQPKEVCFPGGQMDKGETPTQAALRETHEELGIPSGAITVLGELDFIATAAGFLIHPVLAVVDDVSALRPSAEEVDHTFVVPLSFFAQTKPLSAVYDLVPRTHDDFPYDVLNVPNPYPFRTAPVESPVWLYTGHPIWGLTARIVHHLLQFMKNLDE